MITVYLAEVKAELLDAALLGVFTSIDKAKAACNAHYAEHAIEHPASSEMSAWEYHGKCLLAEGDGLQYAIMPVVLDEY